MKRTVLRENKEVVEDRRLETSQLQPAKRHKRLDTILNVILILTVCVSIAVYKLPIFGNQLYAPQETHNFGFVKDGTVIRHKFTVRNLHLWPVTVTAVHGDCGCTQTITGKTPPFRLAPFSSVDVTASLDTRGKQGHVSQSVYVATIDNIQGTPLFLKGEVR